MASIEDVANRASVSIATVSRVLNNPSLVSEKTSERVREAIKQLGYVPNPFAQGLITRASRVLGIALPDIHGEFYSELLRGADAEARRQDYHLLVSSEHRATAAGGSRNLAFGLVDGLIVMITEPNAGLWREARELALPVVVMDLETAERGVDCILIDNSTGTREAVEHLLQDTDAACMCFVGGPKENFDTRKRAEVFTQTLRHAGVSASHEHLAFGEYSVRWGFEWAMEQLRVLTSAKAHDSSSKRRADDAATCSRVGVLAANDEIALGVMQAARELGLRVPQDVRIVGFDDTRLASLVRPALSSVRVPLAEAGAAAVAHLVKRVEDPDRERETMRLPTKLVVRESSKA